MLSSLLGHVDTRQVAFASDYPRRMQNGVDWVYASAASRAGSIAATKLARFAVRSVTKSAGSRAEALEVRRRIIMVRGRLSSSAKACRSPTARGG